MVCYLNKKTGFSVLLAIIFFSLGSVFGWLGIKHKETNSPVLIRENSSDYKFINPVLLLQVPEDESVPEFQSLRKTVTDYIDSSINKNQASEVSVYFRELNTDHWIGVNTENKYSPASMLKVASLIAFFRASENEPELLSKEVYLTSNSDNQDVNQDYYPPIDKIKIDHAYSAQDLLSSMIIDSDNNAAVAINTLTGNEILNKTYSDLKIPIPDGNVIDNTTAQMYSRLFRALYNGTYISRELSEKALNLLSHTKFTNGLVAGVEKGIVISHKFGERIIKTINSKLSDKDQTVHELHDCGIVYKPNDPYFICVMTKGNNFISLQKIISDISSIVWVKMQNFKN